LEKPVADSKQIMEEMRIAIERYSSPRNWEEADRLHTDLKAEIKAIAERHGVPFQDWGGYEDLKKRAAEIGKTKG
jgi:hypothetical protein